MDFRIIWQCHSTRRVEVPFETFVHVHTLILSLHPPPFFFPDLDSMSEKVTLTDFDISSSKCFVCQYLGQICDPGLEARARSQLLCFREEDFIIPLASIFTDQFWYISAHCLFREAYGKTWITFSDYLVGTLNRIGAAGHTCQLLAVWSVLSRVSWKVCVMHLPTTKTQIRLNSRNQLESLFRCCRFCIWCMIRLLRRAGWSEPLLFTYMACTLFRAGAHTCMLTPYD